MRTFHYLELDAVDLGITVSTTDSGSLDWIEEEVKKAFPRALSTREEDLPDILPGVGGRYSFTLRKVKNKHAVKWWIFRALCQTGWEPFSVGTGVVHLRRTTTEG